MCLSIIYPSCLSVATLYAIDADISPYLYCIALRYGAVQCSRLRYRTVKCSTVRWNTVRCRTVLRSTVRCSAVRCSTVWWSKCGAVQCIAVQCGAVKCGVIQQGAVQCAVIHCSAVQCGAVQCDAVQCGAVQCLSAHFNCLATVHLISTMENGSIQIQNGLIQHKFKRFASKHGGQGIRTSSSKAGGRWYYFHINVCF